MLDIGLAASTPGTVFTPPCKGMVDAGLDIPHGEDVYPDDDRVNGAHIDDDPSRTNGSHRTTIEEAY